MDNRGKKEVRKPIVSEEKRQILQIANLVDRDVVKQFSKFEWDIIRTTISSETFVKFCALQVTAVEAKMQSVVINGSITPEEIQKLLGDFQLNKRFWLDLKMFAEDQVVEVE